MTNPAAPAPNPSGAPPASAPRPHQDLSALSAQIKAESAFVDGVVSEVGKVIVGQRTMVERVLIGLLTGGHVLLEGVPGLAKTLTLTTLATVLRLGFKRVQFTPDLLPADLTGTSIWDPERRAFEPRTGPIFTNLLLADEVNRAPAKVQSALLEAMQEHRVTIGDETFDLPSPFFVMATQSRVEERQIMDRMTEGHEAAVSDVVGPEELVRARRLVKSIYVDEKIKDYIVDLVFASRDPEKHGLKNLAPLIAYGASPRATIALNLAARAHAFLRHRAFVTPDDIKAIGADVLRHRVHLSFEAEAEEVRSDDVVRQIFENVKVP
jgi:MoxR-like ATPase